MGVGLCKRPLAGLTKRFGYFGAPKYHAPAAESGRKLYRCCVQSAPKHAFVQKVLRCGKLFPIENHTLTLTHALICIFYLPLR